LTTGETTTQKIFVTLQIVKEKIALEKKLGFQTRIEDLHLKGDISKGNPKINISGSTFLFRRKPVLGSKINASRPEALGVFGKIPISPGKR